MIKHKFDHKRIFALNDAGWEPAEIAEDLKCTPKYVWGVLRRAGKKPNRSHTYRVNTKVSRIREEYFRKFYNAGYSVGLIAKIFKVDKSALYSRAITAGWIEADPENKDRRQPITLMKISKKYLEELQEKYEIQEV